MMSSDHVQFSSYKAEEITTSIRGKKEHGKNSLYFVTWKNQCVIIMIFLH